MKQIDYARMLEVINTSDNPEAALAAFVMREVQVVSAELVDREQRLRDGIKALADEWETYDFPAGSSKRVMRAKLRALIAKHETEGKP